MRSLIPLVVFFCTLSYEAVRADLCKDFAKDICNQPPPASRAPVRMAEASQWLEKNRERVISEGEYKKRGGDAASFCGSPSHVPNIFPDPKKGHLVICDEALRRFSANQLRFSILQRSYISAKTPLKFDECIAQEFKDLTGEEIKSLTRETFADTTAVREITQRVSAVAGRVDRDKLVTTLKDSLSIYCWGGSDPGAKIAEKRLNLMLNDPEVRKNLGCAAPDAAHVACTSKGRLPKTDGAGDTTGTGDK